jgi:tetratricopeptide (TPR) repeat protein
MKALEKDRARRYGSASDFAADIRRHLTRQPVLAGPPGAMYRSRKFVQRHRLGVAVAAGLLVMLTSVAIITAVQAQRLARERDRANTEARHASQEAAAARQVTDFLVGLFKVSDPSEARGNALTAREILDSGARRIDETLTTQPEVRARLQATIGAVYTNLGLYSSAEPLLRSAVDTYRQLTGSDSAETLAASSALGDEYFYTGRFAQAEAVYREVVAARTRRLGPEHPDTLRASFDLAGTYLAQKNYQNAEALHRRIVAIQSRVIGKEHPDTLATLNNLGVILLREERYQEAAVLNADLLETRRRVFGETHPDTLRSLHQLGVTYTRLGRFDEAEKLLIRAKETKQRVIGEAHPSTILTMYRLADVYIAQRRYADAESELLAAARRLGLDVTSPAPARPIYAEGTEINVAERIAELYRTWGKTAAAAQWSAKVRK